MSYRLKRGVWYAAEFLGDGLIRLGHRYSPIRVDEITPMKTGKRIFELNFFHANYPEGVQDKLYRLQTLQAGEEYILGKSVDHDPARFVLIYDIDAAWLKEHFNIDLAATDDVASWLNREYPGVIQSSSRA